MRQIFLGFVLIALGLLGAGARDARAAEEGISSEQADAILEELRAIRELLEQQGRERPSSAGAAAPGSSTVRLPWVERPSLGPKDASVVVVEFTDYACPYCQNFHQSTWPVLKRDFVDTGQVRWMVRDLPLPIHPDARDAAQAVHCAGEQKRFWELRPVLYANRTALGREALERHAQSVGVEAGSFRRCLEDGRQLGAIDADARAAGEARITGTPSFVVGRRKGDYLEGQLIVGAQGAPVFDGAIRLELAKSAPAR